MKLLRLAFNVLFIFAVLTLIFSFTQKVGWSVPKAEAADTRDPNAILTKEDEDGCFLGACNYYTYHCEYEGSNNYIQKYVQPYGFDHETSVACPNNSTCHNYIRSGGTGIQCVPKPAPPSCPVGTTVGGLQYSCSTSCPSGSERDLYSCTTGTCCLDIPAKPACPVGDKVGGLEYSCSTSCPSGSSRDIYSCSTGTCCLDLASSGSTSVGQTNLTSTVTVSGTYSRVEITLNDSINQIAFKQEAANSSKTHTFSFGKIYRTSHTLTAKTFDSSGNPNGTATKSFTPTTNEVQTAQNLTVTVGSTATPPPATPPPNDPDSCINVDNNDNAFVCQASCTGTWSQPYTKTPYNKCSTGQCCYDPTKYPRSSIGNSGGGSTTPAPGGGTSAPGGGTPGPASGPCAGVKGGVLTYVNGTCNEKLFDPTKAAAREFCGGVYKDKYICQNIDPTTNQRYVDYVPSGGNTCSQAPWCPSTSTTTTPAPGPDANCTADQGQTCHPGDFSNKIYCCEPNKNLECTNPNPALPNSYTCQYKGGAPFTPTPGASGNCSASNFGHWGAGCPCPTGGGCGTGLGCYREATSKTFPPDNANGQFCAVGRWCAQSQTDVPNTAACLGATPYSTPTPSSGGGGYQVDCPYYNTAGGLSNNECQDGTQCLPGYTHAPIGPGGTNGDRICTETNGRPNVCCTKLPSGTTTTPAPGGGTGTTPAATATPRPSSYTPPTSCVGHPANTMCGSASDANTQCFYPGGRGYWGWKGEGNGCDLGSGTQTHCYVCTP